MKQQLLIRSCGGLILLSWFCAAGSGAVRAADSGNWERSVVSLEITRKQYDYFQPWSTRTDNFHKFGLVIGPRQILTTAEYLNDATLVRLQKGGRGIWWNAQIQWLDYLANLATLTVADNKFWADLTPATLVDTVPTKGSVEIVRWRNGILETRKGEINRLVVKRGKLGFVEHGQMEVDSEITGAGWAETVTYGNQVVGLTGSQEGTSCTVIPASFIRFVLSGANAKPYRGLGFFDFIWQKAQNPATLKYLKLEGEPRGVIIIEFVSEMRTNRLLRARDVILEVDGFAIDTEGDYQDPVYGKLSLENLSTRQRWAGDEVKLTVLRNGELLHVAYPLPRAEYGVELVPEEVFDHPPEYVMLGGLVFEPLTEPYLRIWGSDWRRKAPFRLVHYNSEKPTPNRPARVLLSLILPDPFNLGYQDYRLLTVDKVNGRLISRLSDLRQAVRDPKDGFHLIEFGRGESLRRMVLDASEMESATRRIMERYGLEKDKFLVPPASGELSK